MTPHQYITEETRSLLAQCGCPDVADNPLDDTETYITQEQALRWLRDELNIYIVVMPFAPHVWWWQVSFHKGMKTLHVDFRAGKNYEDTVEEAIQQYCQKLIEKRNNMKPYIKPDIHAHKLTPVSILSASSTGCNCGCPKSDVYAGGCACNNGRGCPGCGADHGGGIVGSNFTRKISSVEDEIPYE